MKKYFLLLILFLMLAWNRGYAQNSNNPIRDSLSRASEQLAYHPDSIDLRLKKASWNLMLEQWDYAHDDYDKVLNKDPQNIAALYYRAFVNEKQGRFNFARLDYTNLLKLVPGNFEAQLGLALLNQKDKHYTEAFDEINRLVEQFPDSAVAYAARAGIEKERKMLELAEFDYTKAINKDGSNHDYILNRADIRIQLGKFDDAKDDLDRLVRMGVPRASMKEYYMRIK
jgi:tetratricopeptide (TPR) repeat protein